MALWDEDSAEDDVINEINVVPLIDIMLVLLVLFIATASVATTEVFVNLAQADAQAEPDDQQPLVVVVTQDGQFQLDKNSLSLDALQEQLTQRHQANDDQAVQLQADADVRFEYVGQAMAAIQTSGIENVEVLTEP